jgi:hypothetical protein
VFKGRFSIKSLSLATIRLLLLGDGDQIILSLNIFLLQIDFEESFAKVEHFLVIAFGNCM